MVSPLNQKFVFSTIHEVDQFLVGVKDLFKPTKEDEFGLVWVHFWIPLFFSKENCTFRYAKYKLKSVNYQLIEFIAKIHPYIIISSSTIETDSESSN